MEKKVQASKKIGKNTLKGEASVGHSGEASASAGKNGARADVSGTAEA